MHRYSLLNRDLSIARHYSRVGGPGSFRCLFMQRGFDTVSRLPYQSLECSVPPTTLDVDGVICVARVSFCSCLPSIRFSFSTKIVQQAKATILKHLCVDLLEDNFSVCMRAQSIHLPHRFARDASILPLGIAQCASAGLVLLHSPLLSVDMLKVVRSIIVALCRAASLERNREFASQEDWQAIELAVLCVVKLEPQQFARTRLVRSSLSPVWDLIAQIGLREAQMALTSTLVIFGRMGGKLTFHSEQSVGAVLHASGIVHLARTHHTHCSSGPFPHQNMRKALEACVPLEHIGAVAHQSSEHAWPARNRSGLRCLVAVAASASKPGIVQSFVNHDADRVLKMLKSNGFDCSGVFPIFGGILGSGIKARRGRAAPRANQGAPPERRVAPPRGLRSINTLHDLSRSSLASASIRSTSTSVPHHCLHDRWRNFSPTQRLSSSANSSSVRDQRCLSVVGH